MISRLLFSPIAEFTGPGDEAKLGLIIKQRDWQGSWMEFRCDSMWSIRAARWCRARC